MLGSWLIGPIAVLMATGYSSEPPPPGRAGKPVTSLDEIAGSWDIARFERYTPTRLHGGIRRAFVEVGQKGLSYNIECNYSGNPAHIDSSGTLHDDGGELRTSTAMLCEPLKDRREGALFGFFGSKPTVRWMENGRLQMSNGRTELILERPVQRRLANLVPPRELAGRWVPQMATQLHEGNGYSGSGFQQPALVVITPDSLSYSGCGGARFTFRYTQDGRMADVVEQGRAECGSDSPSATLLKIVRDNPLVERDASGLALAAGDLVVNLESEAEVRRRSAPVTPPSGGPQAEAAPPLSPTTPPPPPPAARQDR